MSNPPRGALLVLPLVFVPAPLASFVVFLVWGLLRGQAQGHVHDAGFVENWVKVWSWHKVLAASLGGIGAGVAHCALYLCLN